MSMSFLMCSERSGSNLILKLLNGHSKICGPSTKHIINPVARNLFRYEDIRQAGNWSSLLEDIRNLLDVSFSVWKRSFSIDELKALAPCGDVAALIRNIFFEEARANGKSHVFVKENQVYEFLPFLLIYFSEAKYVYQVRDPRDMALPWKLNPDHPGGVVRAARQWQKDQQNTLKNYNELRKIGKAFFVKYENLIEDPGRVTGGICRFLGVDFEPDMLNFYRDDLTRKNASMQQGWYNLGKAIISENKKKYLTGLIREEVMAVEKICYFEMTYLGYQPEFPIDALNAFPDKRLQEMEIYESQNIPAQRSDGVRMNMEAKKRFYRKEGHIEPATQ